MEGRAMKTMNINGAFINDGVLSFLKTVQQDEGDKMFLKVLQQEKNRIIDSAEIEPDECVACMTELQTLNLLGNMIIEISNAGKKEAPHE
jgi:hypothetical protein